MTTSGPSVPVSWTSCPVNTKSSPPAAVKDNGWLRKTPPRLYRRAHIVLNENLFDGVTTRIFEAMAAGGFLLTENGTNGLTDLFVPGEDLAAYGPEDLVKTAARYLEDETGRRRIALTGQAKVLARHDIRHRAERLLSLMEASATGAGLPPGGRFDLEEGKALFWAGVRWPSPEGPSRRRRAELKLIRAAKQGVMDTESLFLLGILARVRGNRREATARLHPAAESGYAPARIGLGILSMEAGATQEAVSWFRRAARQEGYDFPGEVSGRDLTPDQHVCLARVLESNGFDLTPGFSRSGQHPLLWNALEHYQAALRQNPVQATALMGAGRILKRYHAFTEWHLLLARAAEVHPDLTGLDETVGEASLASYVGRW